VGFSSGWIQTDESVDQQTQATRQLAPVRMQRWQPMKGKEELSNVARK
jgi:hypothetical protein